MLLSQLRRLTVPQESQASRCSHYLEGDCHIIGAHKKFASLFCSEQRSCNTLANWSCTRRSHCQNPHHLCMMKITPPTDQHPAWKCDAPLLWVCHKQRCADKPHCSNGCEGARRDGQSAISNLHHGINLAGVPRQACGKNNIELRCGCGRALSVSMTVR